MIALALLACSCSEPLPPPPEAELPDVVWVTLDTTRADYLGVYGGDPTPAFDGLAARGVRFDWMISHVPATLSSHSSMFTGMDPHGHGVPMNGYPLSDEAETLAERMQSLGYQTIAVIGASVLESDMGLDQGFGVYDDTLGDKKTRRYEDRADVVNQRVWAALEQRDPERPLFLWVHYFDAHAPYEAPEEWHQKFVDADYTPSWGDKPFATGDTAKFGELTPQDLEYVKDSYRAEVAWQDHNLGQLVEGLEERESMDALVVMADHGDLFGDAPDRRFGHASSVNFAVVRVPALLLAPGLSPAVIQRPTRTSDMATTLLSALGLQGLGDGLDLMTTDEAVPIFVEATKPKKIAKRAREEDLWNNTFKPRAVLYEDLYLVSVPYAKTEQVYRVGQPMKPTPRKDEVVEEARAALKVWDEAAPPFRDNSMTSETRKALEALGYL